MFKTLYAKISAIFLLLLLMLGAVLIYVSFNSSINYVCEATQKLNYNLASQFAQRCQPLLEDSIQYALLKKDVMDFKELNPNAEIFMLAEDGTIMASSSEKNALLQKRINMEPVHAFLATESYDALPIFGDDPLSKSQKKIFSVAQVTVAKTKTAFIYVTLASARSDLSSQGILNSYILRSGTIAIFSVLIFTALLGLLFFFFLTKRVHHVTHAVQEFARGNYHKRIEVQSNDDEVAQLAGAFNRMAETLESNLKKLEKNDRLRRDLIANISHDLRSPLTSIQGYLETIQMKSRDLDEEQKAEYLGISIKNVRHLNHLVSQLFELSKLEAEQTHPEKEPFPLTELVQDVILKFQPRADEKNIHVNYDCSAKLPLVNGDIGMIERVLSNLIDNALKYAPYGGNIKIQLFKNNGSVVFNIQDNGPGIAPEDLPHIFDRFYMADKSRSRRQHGSGLGLAIAKRIVEAHSSNLEALSKQGMGTEFRFALPVN